MQSTGEGSARPCSIRLMRPVQLGPNCIRLETRPRQFRFSRRVQRENSFHLTRTVRSRSKYSPRTEAFSWRWLPGSEVIIPSKAPEFHSGSVPAGSGRGSKSSQSSLSTSLTLAAMSLGYGVVQLDVTIVNTALDSIGTSLGGGVRELQWVVSAYTIAFGAFILTSGALGDRIGAKRVFMAGFAIFTSASLACALAPNSAVLIAARAVQGLGAAALVPNSLALLNHAYPDQQARGRAVGIWAAGASLALTAGPLAGGALIALIGWRSIFLVNLPIGVGGLLPSWRYPIETKRNRPREGGLP